ncbi:hypothetical protein AJ80_09402 [Polytolypa hystricis UAMH7299]|uniref:BTB domain-containing protein n=1 Tax=Polytolypa hystricis (strain UAMH7299) TaxID=1447883 RepID=A0A2B7WRC9_POLH7|nr:hypothetical protein AJ80_09402 [Polytolypa hystricis UAMH7299]
MADFKSIFYTPAFSFLVGKDRSCVTIHAGVVQTVSEPINALINNGQMEESNLRVAVLEDVEVDTFIGFCEFLYTGTYITPSLEPADDPKQSFTFRNMATLPSGLGGVTVEPYRADELYWADEPSAANPDDNLSRGYGSKKKKLRDRSRWAEEEPPVEVTYANCPYARLWKCFEDRDFMGQPAVISAKPDMLFHAKLYVFATKYLIDGLRTQCLKSLHRDLCGFSLDKDTAPQIFNLLEFTYKNTGTCEPGGGSPLRDLVSHYVACQAQTLYNQRLHSLLAANGEIGSDLVAKLVK